MTGFIVPGGRNPHRGGDPGVRDGIRSRYASPRKRAEFSPEERELTLELLRKSRATADMNYVTRAARFWLAKWRGVGSRLFRTARVERASHWPGDFNLST